MTVPATDVGGDVQHDLDLLKTQEPVPRTNGRAIAVEYKNGSRAFFESIRGFCRDTGCHETSVIGWLKGRVPSRKFTHISKIEYMTTNPFAGNKLKVTKVITQNQWDKRADHDDFEEDDYNEFYRLMKHKSGEGWLIRLPEQATNPYIK